VCFYYSIGLDPPSPPPAPRGPPSRPKGKLTKFQLVRVAIPIRIIAACKDKLSIAVLALKSGKQQAGVVLAVVDFTTVAVTIGTTARAKATIVADNGKT
jgi:hypothetical protein